MDDLLVLPGILGALAQWGPVAMAAVMYAAAGLALAEAVKLALTPDDRANLLRDMRRAVPWTLALAIAQIAAFGLAVAMNPDNKLLGTFALHYLFFALLIPAIWATGQYHAGATMPQFHQWSQRRIKFTVIALMTIGLALNLFTVLVVDIRPGEMVTGMTEDVEPAAIAAVTIWLILNAPWLEELIFRHYLVPRIARTGSRMRHRLLTLGLAVVLPAALFAFGHAGHMDPLWPKLMQAFGWGLLLGWARIYLGTPYAIALHLFWNMSAPLFAPFIEAV